jgi:hypothetical protein
VHGAHIGGLGRRARRDVALARAQGQVLRARGPEQRRPIGIGVAGEANGRVDLVLVHLEPAPQPVVERAQGGAGDLDRAGGTRDGDAVAARGHGDAELRLDPGQVAVMFAVERRQETVVFELKLNGGRQSALRYGVQWAILAW